MILAEAIGADLAYGFKSLEHPYFDLYRLNLCYDLKVRNRWPLARQISLMKRFSNATCFVSSYTSAVYSGSYSPLAVLSNCAKRNILYCHSPPRFAYDKYAFYMHQLASWQRTLLKAFVDYYRPRYEAALKAMDLILANSHCVKERIKRIFNVDAQVIHPPCDTRRFRWFGQSDYYLSTARLDSLKRVDQCIKAFQSMPQKKLIVTSGGPELGRLKRTARGASNIHFTGFVDEKMLQQLIGNSIATLYLARNEDFGMSPVESMSAGKPVIGVAEGGLLETVVHGETGWLLPPNPTIDQIVDATNRMHPRYCLQMKEKCERRACQFSQEAFIGQMGKLIGTP